jgi:hypothetical protein
MKLAAVHKSRAMLCFSGSGSLLQICKIRLFMIGCWTGSELKAFLFSIFTVYGFPLHLMGASVLLFLYIQTRTFVQMNSDKDH